VPSAPVDGPQKHFDPTFAAAAPRTTHFPECLGLRPPRLDRFRLLPRTPSARKCAAYDSSLAAWHVALFEAGGSLGRLDDAPRAP